MKLGDLREKARIGIMFDGRREEISDQPSIMFSNPEVQSLYDDITDILNRAIGQPINDLSVSTVVVGLLRERTLRAVAEGVIINTSAFGDEIDTNFIVNISVNGTIDIILPDCLNDLFGKHRINSRVIDRECFGV